MIVDIKRIRSLENKHKGERVFVIGTGPSLNKTDFSLIQDEILFGVNTLYRGHEKFNISPQYYACSDGKVWGAHDEKLLQLDTILFLTGNAAVSYQGNINYYQALQRQDPLLLPFLGYVWHGNFSTDLTRGTYNGDTIIIDICLQACLYMGFEKVYLLGCDCDYSGLHRFDGLQTENVHGGGVSNQWGKSFVSYAICKQTYEANSKEIINCTPDGKLEIFRREELKDVIRK